MQKESKLLGKNLRGDIKENNIKSETKGPKRLSKEIGTIKV